MAKDDRPPYSKWRFTDKGPVLGFSRDQTTLPEGFTVPDIYKRTTAWDADPEGRYGAGSIEGYAANYNPISRQYYDPIVRDPVTKEIISGGNVYGINPDGSVNMQNMLQRRTATGFENLPGSGISGGGGTSNVSTDTTASYEYKTPSGGTETRTPEEGQDQIREHSTNPQIKDVFTFVNGGWHYRGQLGSEMPKDAFIKSVYVNNNVPSAESLPTSLGEADSLRGVPDSLLNPWGIPTALPAYTNQLNNTIPSGFYTPTTPWGIIPMDALVQSLQNLTGQGG